MRNPLGVLPSLLDQAIGAAASADAARAEAERPPWPVNPFPKGIRMGSATSKVMAALSGGHPRWMEHGELMRITGYSRGAVSWAVRYLAEHGMVRSIPSSRHPQYLRYQYIPPKD